MSSPIVLDPGAARYERHARRQATIHVPYSGASATLHLRETQIVQTMRDLATDPNAANSLWLLSLDVNEQALSLHIAGPDTAIEHWTTHHRLITAAQHAIDHAATDTEVRAAQQRS